MNELHAILDTLLGIVCFAPQVILLADIDLEGNGIIQGSY